MISNSFFSIFSLEVLHSYFKNNVCKGLVYTPSKETDMIINRFLLKLKITNKGFELYTDSQSSIEEFLNYITLATSFKSFDFKVTTTNAQFYNFTNLPINQLGIIKYNSSTITSKVDIIQLTPSFIKEQKASFLFNLTINFEDLISLQKNNAVANYQIQFETRETQWKYFIVNNSMQNVGELSIKSGSEVQFIGPNDAVLQDGQIAQEFFLENQLLPLSEVPKYQFDLMATTKKNGANRTKIIYKGLPTPNPDIIEINTGSTEPIVTSLMYVYV